MKRLVLLAIIAILWGCDKGRPPAGSNKYVKPADTTSAAADPPCPDNDGSNNDFGPV